MEQRKLTPKQERFCQLVASGKNYSDAYRDSYDCQNMKGSTINRDSFELAQDNKISARIDEIKKEMIKELRYTAKESWEKLKEIQEIALNKCKKTPMGDEIFEPDLTAAIRAEELKGKLAQLYVEKKEVSLSGDLKERADELRKELFGTHQE